MKKGNKNVDADLTNLEYKLREYASKLEDAEKNAGLGSWEFDCKTGKTWWSNQMFRMFGLNISDTAPTLAENLERIHPEDQPGIIEVFDHMSKGILPPVFVFRTNPKYGPIKYFLPTLRFDKDSEGNLLKFIGTQLDITDRFNSEKEIREREFKYRRLHENMSDCFVQFDLEGRIIDNNRLYHAMLGYSDDEIKKLKYQDITPQKWADYEKNILETEVFSKGKTAIYEKEYIKKDGTVFPVEVKVHLLRDENGNQSGLWAIVRDISERKKAEDNLKTSEALHKAIFNASPDDITVTDMDGIIKMVSPVTLKIFSYDNENQIIGRNIKEFIHPDNLERANIDLKKLVRDESLGIEVFKAFKSDGSTFDAEITADFIRDVNGNSIGMIFILRDITERKRAEIVLRNNDLIIRSIFSNASVAIGIVKDRIFKEVNNYFCHITGYSVTEVIGKNSNFLYESTEEYNRVGKYLYSQMKDTGTGTVETVWKKKNGGLINITLSGTKLNDDNSTEHTFTAIDITSTKESRKVLQESEKKYRTYINFAPIGIIIFNNLGDILETNNFLSVITGYLNDELLNMKITDLLSDEFVKQGQAFLANLIKENNVFGEINIIRKDKEPKWLEIRAVKLSENRYMGYATDITQRKIDTKKLIEFKESVGQSVDGVAIADLHGNISYVNNAWAELHKYNPDELIGNHLSLFHNSEQLENEVRYSIEVTQKKGSFIGEIGHMRSDGTTFPTLMSTTLLFDENNMPFGMVGVARDISDMKRKELIQQAYIDISEFAYTHTLDELIQKTLDVAEELTNSKIGFYHFVNEDQINLSLQTWSTNTIMNMCTAEGKGRHYPITEAGVWVDCIREKKPIIHNDYESLSNKRGLPEGHAKITRELLIPVYRNNKAVSILGVGNKDSDYNQQDVEIITHLAELSWDITIRKQVENEIKKSEEKFRKLISSVPFPIGYANSKYEIEYLNENFIEEFGYDYNDIPTLKEWTLLAYPDESFREYAIEKWKEFVKKAESGETDLLTEEYNITCKSGEIKTMLINIVYIDNHYLFTFVNLTDRIKAEKEIFESKITYENLFDNTPVSIWEEDFTYIYDDVQSLKEKGIIDFNRYLDEHPEKLIEYSQSVKVLNINRETVTLYKAKSKEELISNLASTFLPESFLVFKSEIIAIADGKSEYEAKTRVKTLNGDVLDVIVKMFTHNINNKYIAYVTTFDISKLSEVEAEMRKLNEELENRVRERTAQLESANKDLESFAYSVSHDLRAPLRHVDGFSRILRNSIQDKSVDTNRYFNKITESTNKMAKLIDDLLSFSRLGRKSIDKKEVNLNELVEDVITHFIPDTKNRSIQWKIGKLQTVKADENLLKQVLLNLISNAIKFTSKNENPVIEIGPGTSSCDCTFFIRDNGVGFDMKYVAKLFGVFQRLHTQDEFEGTGIGLANVKQIIQKHGGSIHAEGELNKGAAFFVKI